MPISSAGLSFVPNVSIANSLTNGGAASMSRSPTSSTGERHVRFEAGEQLGDAERDAGGDEPGEDGERAARAIDRRAGARAVARPAVGGQDVLGGHPGVRRGVSARMVPTLSREQSQHGALDRVAR